MHKKLVTIRVRIIVVSIPIHSKSSKLFMRYSIHEYLSIMHILHIINIVYLSLISVSAHDGDDDLHKNNTSGQYVAVSDMAMTQKCADCRLTANSVYELTRQPRQMDSYGHMSDKIDLERIKKTVCREIISDIDRENCRSFFFSNINKIREWKQQNERSTQLTQMSFLDFVCIKELKLCCPHRAYGPRCTKCPACGPNQHCHGEGTRTGNGSCVCKSGHSKPPACATCLPGYYMDYVRSSAIPSSANDNSNEAEQQALLCKPCHRSCKFCRKAGPLGCEVCQKGFTWVQGFGCSDVDECVQSKKKICGENTFCVNTEGSYFCYECDRGCDGCHGDGPDMCLRCAKGYNYEKGNCIAQKKSIIPPEGNYVRYAVYFGLSVCTCVLLRDNIYLASAIGLATAIYISASEYYFLSSLTPST